MRPVAVVFLVVVTSVAHAQAGGTEWRFLNDSDVLGTATNLGSAPVITLWSADVTRGTNPPQLKIYPEGLVQRSRGQRELGSATLPPEVVRSWVAKIVETGVIDLTAHQLQALEIKARQKYPRSITPPPPRHNMPPDPWTLDMGRVRHHRVSWILEVLIVLDCRCPPSLVERYRGRISGPLLDRIDLHVEVPPVKLTDLRSPPGEASEPVAKRVAMARRLQLERCGREVGAPTNAAMDPEMVRRHCVLDTTAQSLLDRAFDKLALSARALTRILKVARTLADLAERERISSADVAEAIQYRGLNRRVEAW